jgi:hypothetical protein
LSFYFSSITAYSKGKRLRKRLPFDVYPHILEDEDKGKLVARRSTNA